jgi:hypothetical protein
LPVRAFFQELAVSKVTRTRPTLPVEAVRERVSRFASAKVAVLGDIMLDR